jgi:putative phage-type endonuclease
MSEIVQGTDAWFQIRCGKATASRIADIIARTKSGYSASRANYAAQLVAERLTGTVAESFINAAMQHGTDTEPLARSAYQFYTDADVAQEGFVLHPSIADAGASPDGLVGDAGLVEIKCPNTATHIDTLLSGAVPGKYLTQMLWQMACTGRQWCDFVSFDPRLPESMRLFVHRVDRDDARIAELETEVVTFLNEVRDTVHRLRSKYDPEPADDLLKLRMAG